MRVVSTSLGDSASPKMLCSVSSIDVGEVFSNVVGVGVGVESLRYSKSVSSVPLLKLHSDFFFYTNLSSLFFFAFDPLVWLSSLFRLAMICVTQSSSAFWSEGNIYSPGL